MRMARLPNDGTNGLNDWKTLLLPLLLVIRDRALLLHYAGEEMSDLFETLPDIE